MPVIILLLLAHITRGPHQNLHHQVGNQLGRDLAYAYNVCANNWLLGIQKVSHWRFWRDRDNRIYMYNLNCCNNRHVAACITCTVKTWTSPSEEDVNNKATIIQLHVSPSACISFRNLLAKLNCDVFMQTLNEIVHNVLMSKRGVTCCISPSITYATCARGRSNPQVTERYDFRTNVACSTCLADSTANSHGWISRNCS